MLLTDVFIIENLEVLQESTGNKTMKVRGIFQRAEESNNNGRVYPTPVLTKQVDKLQSMISERRLCGELDHPQNDSVKLSNASHLITKLYMKGNEVFGEAEILNTPAGLTAKALINGGVKIGISSRGMGTLSEDSKGHKIVNEDFNLITFDLVADPSTRGAYPALSESKTRSFVNESTTKLQKEENFVTLLKQKFNEGYENFMHEMKHKGSKKLKGKQHKLDVNKNGKLDSADFKMLRSKQTNEMKVTSKPSAKELLKLAKAEISHAKMAKKAGTSLTKLNKAVKKQDSKNADVSKFSKDEKKHSKMAASTKKTLQKLKSAEEKEHEMMEND
jgi:hypothetical protein